MGNFPTGVPKWKERFIPGLFRQENLAEINLCCFRVLNLKSVLARPQYTGVAEANQVLLINGGESLQDNQRVAKYQSGTVRPRTGPCVECLLVHCLSFQDTNPIFLFNRAAIEADHAPELSFDMLTDIPGKSPQTLIFLCISYLFGFYFVFGLSYFISFLLFHLHLYSAAKRYGVWLMTSFPTWSLDKSQKTFIMCKNGENHKWVNFWNTQFLCLVQLKLFRFFRMKRTSSQLSINLTRSVDIIFRDLIQLWQVSGSFDHFFRETLRILKS